MNQRISAGALILRGNRMLFVRHQRADRYDFWIPPGGGVLPGEDAATAAAREVREETGLVVGDGRFVMVEELERPGERQCKLWFFFDRAEGGLFVGSHDARSEYIVDARFLSREEMQGRVVVPQILHDDRFWQALAAGFPEPIYLGLREMSFW